MLLVTFHHYTEHTRVFKAHTHLRHPAVVRFGFGDGIPR